MARSEELKRWQSGLRATFPLVGSVRRRWAMRAVEARRNDRDVVPLLVEAIGLSDDWIASRAAAALADLASERAIDALCALWARTRDERLGQIIARRRYTASSPALVRVLSGLKAGACDVLSHGDAESIPHLVAALEDKDPVVQQNALAVLQALRNPKGVDGVCALWARTRDKRLEQIIAQRSYIAAAPVQVKILSALKCGGRVTLDRADVIPFVVSLLQDADESLRTGAVQSLEQVVPGAAQDALCDEAINEPGGEAAKICLRTGKRPGDHDRLCLFLFITRQLDEYFKEDFEFQNLRLQYNLANAMVRAHVMEVVRSGDRRCTGFFGAQGKPLAECTDKEIHLAINLWLRQKDWQRVCNACFRLPLKHSLRLFDSLRSSEWTPDNGELRSLLAPILEKAKDVSRASVAEYVRSLGEHIEELCELEKEEPKRKARETLGAIFERLGVDASDCRGTVEALIASLDSSDPTRLDLDAFYERLIHEGSGDSPLARALESRDRRNSRRVQKLVKAYNRILDDLPWKRTQIRHDLARTNEFIRDADIFNLWPSKATVRDLDAVARLRKVGSEENPSPYVDAWKAALDLLDTLIKHNITTPMFEPVVVDASEFTGEFTEAGDIDFEVHKND